MNIGIAVYFYFCITIAILLFLIAVALIVISVLFLDGTSPELWKLVGKIFLMGCGFCIPPILYWKFTTKEERDAQNAEMEKKSYSAEFFLVPILERIVVFLILIGRPALVLIGRPALARFIRSSGSSVPKSSYQLYNCNE